MAVELPQLQPVGEMPGLNAEAQVRGPKAASISGRATSLQRPELPNVGQMCRPIVNVGVEDWAKHRVLANVRVERFKQLLEACLPTNSIVEGCGHAVD